MSYLEMEENEERFVSLFSERYDEHLKIYTNRIMNDDPFFNRAYVECNSISLKHVEDLLQPLNLNIYLYTYHECKEFEAYGYTLYDKLSTLMLESPYLVKGVEGIIIDRVSILEDWLYVYSIAFGNDKEEMRRRVDASRGLDLYTATIKGKVVGCMALLASKNILGLYCLGILQEFRRLGIASSLIRYAYERAREMGSYLILQTFLKDNLLRYYIKHGFTQMYVKYVYTKADL